MPELQNWIPVLYRDHRGTELSLAGKVYGHERIEDSHRVVTSELREFDLKKMQAKTRSGTVYDLKEQGKPEDVKDYYGYTEYLSVEDAIKLLEEKKCL
jgi:hypothetical protein